MSEWKVANVIEQAGTFDGEWKLPVDSYLLMKIVNHLAAEDTVDIVEMDNPIRLAVRVVIEVKEIEPPQEENRDDRQNP